jgi:hypothetical protein
MTKFCVALTFDDVSTIWVYKVSITRMVGRLFVSLNEVLRTSSSSIGSVRAEGRDFLSGKQ